MTIGKEPDYLYYQKGDYKIKKDKYPKKTWFDMKSITKLFLLFVILDMKLDLHSCIQEYFKEFPYKNIKIIDIINHTSGLDNTWMINGKSSDLQKEYYKSKNIYEFSLTKLKQNLPYGKFNYNNYTYDILAAIIYKISGKYWISSLEKFFPNCRFKIHKQHKIPFSSYSLFIRKQDIQQISNIILNKKYHTQIIKKKIIPHVQKFYLKLNFTGHDGSGGQDLMFNNKEIFWILSYDNPDLHKRGLNENEFYHILNKIRH